MNVAATSQNECRKGTWMRPGCDIAYRSQIDRQVTLQCDPSATLMRCRIATWMRHYLKVVEWHNCDLIATSHWDMNTTFIQKSSWDTIATWLRYRSVTSIRLYMKVAVEHKCDLIAISHLDIDATLYESRRGAQLRPNCDIALGYECDIKTTLYESHQKT